MDRDTALVLAELRITNEVTARWPHVQAVFTDDVPGVFTIRPVGDKLWTHDLTTEVPWGRINVDRDNVHPEALQHEIDALLNQLEPHITKAF